ncbi:hypothetical protein ACOME3_010201 [Neoechinorhynchus agilis]
MTGHEVAPEFQKPPAITQVDNGLSVLIDSIVQANPPPSCTWYLNDKPVVKSARIIPSLEKRGSNFQCSLLIKNVGLDDGGIYRLIIKNELGELKATVNLQLQADDEPDEDRKGPKFTQKPVIRQESDGVVFECRLTADSPPQCEWYKGTDKLETGGRYIINIQSLPDDSYLVSCTVKDIQATDGGAYRVVAKNANGEATATLSLNISDNKGRPNILENIQIRPFVDKVDDAIMIQCLCEADPVPDFVWYFKGNPLSQSSKYVNSVLVEGDKYVAVLVINNVTKSDSGEYRLVARNNKGEHSANINVDGGGARILPSGVPPKQISPTKCQMKGSDLIISTEFEASPLPSFNWTRNDNHLNEPRFIPTVEKTGDGKYTAQLTVKNATTKDSAKYACTALNELGSMKAELQLLMKNGKPEINSPNDLAPSLTGSPKIKFDSDNKILQITCPLKAQPSPTIKWSKKKVALSNKGKTDLKVEPTDTGAFNAVLTITDFEPDDNGFYKLEAINSAGVCTANFMVDSSKAEKDILRHNVELTKPETSYNQNTGTLTIKLNCISSGKPAIAWIKDGKKIAKNAHYVPSTKDENPMAIKLLIKDFKSSDFGKYSVKASIGDISDTKVIVVDEDIVNLKEADEEIDTKDDEPQEEKSLDEKVEDKDAKKSKNEDQQAAALKKEQESKPCFVGQLRTTAATDGDKVVLQWNYESSSPLSEIVWFHNGKEISPSDDFVSEDDGKSVRLILKDAYVDDAGDYKCIIRNKSGSDDRSTKVTVNPRRGRAPRRKPKPRAPKPKPKETSIKASTAKDEKGDSPVKQISKDAPKAVSEVPKKDTALDERTNVPNVDAKASTPETAKKEEIPYRMAGSTARDSPKPGVIDESTKASIPTDKHGDTLLRESSRAGKVDPKSKEGTPTSGIEAAKTDALKPLASRQNSPAISPRSSPKKVTPGVSLKKVPQQALRATVKPALGVEVGAASATPLGAGDGAKWPTLRKTTVAKKVPDHWVVHMADKTSNEEEGTTTMEATFCRAGGRLRWYKNRVEIFHGQKYNFISEGPVQKLQINKIIPDDSGRYICSVNDVETKAWLEVASGKPDFEFYLQLPAKNEVFRTKSCLLECHVNHPDCPVRWTKDGKQIDKDDKKYSMIRDLTRCLLRINKTVRADEGVYACEIEGVEDKKTSCYLYITEPQWRFSKKLPPTIEVDESMDSVLEVQVEDPDAECEWFHKGELIPDDNSNSKYVIESHGRIRRLTIKGCRPTIDSGFVECKTGVMVTQTNLIVKPKLKILDGLKDLKLKEGNDIDLKVELSMPRKNVAWLFNGKRILPDANHIILNDGNQYTLKIRETTLGSGGKYSMTIDGLETSCDIIVNEADKKPEIDMSEIPKHMHIVEGNKLRIVVPFRANPAPDIQWLVNGKPIAHSDAKMTSNGKQAILEIPVTKRSDTATYSIRLGNSVGEAKADIAVVVAGKPDAPEGPMRISEGTKSGCLLGWRAPLSDGGSPIMNYTVEQQDAATGTWEQIAHVPADSVKYKVGGLSQGKTYNFRVRAVNKAGISIPLEASQPFVAKNPYDVATAPGPLEVVDVDAHEVTLQWTPPENDGGAKIEQYVVEKRSPGTDWTRAAIVNGSECKAVVKDLTVETKFDFRVMALNKAGLSDSSNLQKPCLTTPKTVKPVIRKGALKDTTIKKGHTLRLLIPFVAKPTPDVVWMLDGKEIKPEEDKRVEVKNTDKSSELVLKDILRSNQGKYSVKLTNSAGSDSTWCNVVVLGPPDRPVGPLKVNEVTKNSVALSWSPPADNGGKPIKNYIIEKMDVNSGEWVRAAETEGTSFNVPKLKQNHRYKFRVSAESDEGISEPLEIGDDVLVKPPFDEPGAPGIPIVLDKDRSHISIKWSPPSNDGGAPIYGYILERKAKPSDKWMKIHPEDFVTSLKFNDIRVKPNEFYEYRVTALNEAGPGPSSASTGQLQAKPDKEAPKLDTANLPKIGGRNELRVYVGDPIDLTLPMIGTPKPEVECTKFVQDAVQPSRLQLTQNEETLSLKHPSATRGDSGIYEIKISNELGTDTEQVHVVVIGPPSPVKGPLMYENTGKSEVLLKWEAPEDDGGLPLLGYVLEKCPAGSDTWEPCGEAATTRFTVRNLEPMQKYKFRVKAQNQKGTSEPVDTENDILIKPPYDPPGAPTQPEITAFDKDFVALKWTKPLSDGGNPIQGYSVEMREVQSGAEWMPCISGLVRDTECMATSVKPGRNYEFRVKAINEAGSGEPSKASKPQKTVSPITPPSTCGQPVVDSIDTTEAKLSWKPPDDDGGAKVNAYVIEVSNSAEPGVWTVAAEVPGRDRCATIPKLKKGSDVSFRITAVNEAGSSSPSAATDYMLVEDPPEPPRFLDLSQLKDIICKAGDSSTVTVGFKGFPIPNVELSMPEEPDRVLDTTRLTSKLDGDQVLIGNTSAERGDTGLYKLSLRNSLGTASTTFHVTVFDTPAIPSGPVETSVIDREHCIVSWAAPKDDGGKPISGYVVEKCAQGTTNWVKCGSARGDVPECVVSGIKEGDKYAFRVIAQNELGDSKPLETDGYVEMKLPYSVPEKPGDVSCVGHTSESISIAWDQPVSDGGNPITHYVVEKMDDTEGSDWTKVGRTPANNPTMVIPRLEEGHKYHFRVAAVNDAGQGEWQKTLDSLEAREPDIAPKLLDHSQGLRKIRIIKGDPLQINLRYQSSPLPQITIKKNGVDLDKPMDKIEKSGANFLIPASEVTDAGQYEFILSNPLGKCISQYAVEIIDVPSAPSGPLEASNVTPSGCILSWEPPSNTGGAEVQRYVIEAMDTKKGTWEPISKYCRDCSFEVFDLKENNEYKFRVAAVNEGGVSEYLEIEKPIIARAAVGRPEPPRDLQLEKNTFDEVALKWNPPDDHHSGKIIGYQVECRRADEPDEWSLLNTEPIRTNDFSIDSLLPGRSYEFRVSAINSAGVGDPAELSKPVKTKGCNRPPQAPMAPEAYTVGNDFVEIAWEPPSETGGSPILHYIVEKRLEGETEWTEEPMTSIEPYKTVHGLPVHSNVEFRVRAVNAQGTSEPSFSSGKILVSTIKDASPVEITKGLQDKRVLPSTPCQFVVNYKGSPEPEVHWFRNNMEIFPGTKYAISTKAGTSTLTVSDVWPGDNQSIIGCSVTNPLGVAKSECILNVKEAPAIGRYERNISTSEGLSAILKLPVTGDRSLDVEVVQCGTSQPDERFNISDDGSTVVVGLKNAKKTDSGSYKIILSNDAGQVCVPFELSVKGPPEAPTGPLSVSNVGKEGCTLQWNHPQDESGTKVSHYTVEKRDLTKPNTPWIEIAPCCNDTTFSPTKLVDGHEYEFRVKAVNEEGESEPLYTSGSVKIELPYKAPKTPQQPIATVTGPRSVRLNWAKPTGDHGPNALQYVVEKKEKDSPVWVRVTPSTKQPSTWTSMDIPNLTADREYEFRVIAVNDAGQSEPSTPSEIVNLADANAVKLPELLKPLDDATVNEGSDAKFEAEISTIDPRSPVDIVWMKGGHELHSGPNCVISRSGNTVSLVLKQCSAAIDGETISLKLKNDSGIRRSSATVNVRTKPKMKLPSSYQSEVQVFDRGQQMNLRIPYTANPKPEVEIYIDGKEVELNKADCPFIIEQTPRCLNIKSEQGLTENDTGLIKVILSNCVGKDEASIRTAIVKPPEKPTELTVDDVFEDAVILSWQPSVSDPYSVVTGYKIEVLDQGKPQGWKPCGSSKSPKFFAGNLPPGKYSFRVLAESLNGNSEPCEPIENVVIRDLQKSPKGPGYGTSDDGKPIMSRSDDMPSDYDRCYEDIWKNGPPKDTDFKHMNSLYDNYDVFEELGTGPFGTIHRGVDKRTGRNHILKFMPTPDQKQQNLCSAEVNLFGDVKSPNIQHIDEVYEGQDATVLVQEFLSGDDLMGKLKRSGDRMTEPEAIEYIRQACTAVKTLHENHIAHLDLKPEHFVFDTKSNSKRLKLCDLSLAKKMIPEKEIQVSLNSMDFAAPEIVNKEPVGYFTDMWALGAITYTILSGEPPFFNPNDEVTMDNIRRGKFTFPESKFGNISDEGKDFISSLLKKQKGQRMDVFDALNHPWLQKDTKADGASLKPNYDGIFNKTRAKYASYPEPRLGIGRSGFFSSMQRLDYKPYKLYDTVFDASEARPRIIISKHNSYALENTDVDLSARVIAFPNAEVSWYRKGAEVDSVGRYHKHRLTNTSYNLRIDKCQVEDAGEYEVSALNSYGEKRVSVWLHVEAVKKAKPVDIGAEKIERKPRKYGLDELWHENERAPTFTYLLRTRMIQSGTPVKLFCTVKANPVPKISWYKGRSEIGPDDDRFAISFQNGVATLDIASVDVDDAGSYRCSAQNKLGTCETTCQLFVQASRRHRRKAESMQRVSLKRTTSRSTRAQTEYQDYSAETETESYSRRVGYIKESDKIETAKSRRTVVGNAPVFTEELASVTVYEGSVLQLRCSVKGRNLTFHWYRSGSELQVSNRINFDYSKEMGVATLNIPVVKTFDEGDYSVTVENQSGKVESSCEVKVKALAKNVGDDMHQEVKEGHASGVHFVKHLRSANLKSGESMHLECVVAGLNEDTKVEWLRNNQLIPDNPDFEKSINSEGACALHVAEVFPEDSGNFGLAVSEKDSDTILTQSACTVVIDESEESDFFVLEYPPSLECSIGQQMSIKTKLRSKEHLPVQYLHNDTELVENEHYTITKKDDLTDYCLHIQALSEQDAGVYKLNFSSENQTTVLSVVHILNVH